MSLSLAYAVLEPQGEPLGTAFILHGILGSGRNWRSFARRLSRAWPGWRLILVDLRGHGDSHPASPPNTLAAAAADLDRLADAVGGPQIVVGHSFGGKVALTYARDYPEGLDAVWVLDALPGGGGEGGADVALVVAALRRLRGPFDRRETLKGALLEMGFSEMLSGWMTTNLRRGEGGLAWRFDLEAVEALLADYLAVDLWELVEDAPCDLHFVRAERSDRWTAASLGRLYGLMGVAVHLLEDSGHWVHAENPDGLLALMTEFGPAD